MQIKIVLNGIINLGFLTIYLIKKLLMIKILNFFIFLKKWFIIIYRLDKFDFSLIIKH